MATTRLVEKRIGEAIGRGGWAVNRIIRDLRDAGLVPVGLPGGGKGAAHWEAHHLVDFAIALGAADASSEAAERAKSYGAMAPDFRTSGREHVIGGSRVTEHSVEPLRLKTGLLGLGGEIEASRQLFPGDSLREGLVLLLRAGAQYPEITAALVEKKFSVVFMRHTLGAWLEFYDGEERKAQHYSPPDRATLFDNLPEEKPGACPIEITARLPHGVFALLIELLRDTLDRQPDTLPLAPSSGPSVPADTPENESAEGVPAPPAPTRDNLSGCDTVQGTLHRPEASPSLSRGQAVSRPDYPPEGGASGNGRQSRSAFAAAA